MTKHIIDDFLAHYDGINRYRVAKNSGITESELSRANQRPLSQLKVKVIFALAVATGKSAGQVLDEMLKMEALE